MADDAKDQQRDRPGPYSTLSDGAYLAGVIRGIAFLFVVGMSFLALRVAQSVVRLASEYEVRPPLQLSSNARTTCIAMKATHAWVCNTTLK